MHQSAARAGCSRSSASLVDSTFNSLSVDRSGPWLNSPVSGSQPLMPEIVWQGIIIRSRIMQIQSEASAPQ